ncbi:MAG: carboxypeptidase regulatory-like domain-containing protein [Gemmatimonadetes bacterium]|nr:carboxypeptidase regulatory-like domain-containing protein [Gemmatimonadota bacterium]
MRRTLAALMVAVAVLDARLAGAQALRGKVIAAGEGPARGVEVRLFADSSGWLIGVKASTMTDSIGDFLVVAPSPGNYVLDVRRIGLKPARSSPFSLKAGDTAEMVVRTERHIATLGGVEVRADSGNSVDFTRGFSTRRARLKGHFLDRAEIEKRGAVTAFDVLAGIQGIRIVDATAGGSNEMRIVADRGGRSFQQGGVQCFIATFVDGIEYDQMELARTLRAADFEAVELYTQAETPSEFRKMNSSCGTVLFWTRSSSVAKKKG